MRRRRFASAFRDSFRTFAVVVQSQQRWRDYDPSRAREADFATPSAIALAAALPGECCRASARGGLQLGLTGT